MDHTVGNTVNTKNEGPTLIIPRLLTTTEEDAEDWHRTTIFCKQVKCQGRICDIIINGDNAKNIVSQEVIDKLQL